MINIYWHGHSFVEIYDGYSSILIDPYIRQNPMCDLNFDQLISKNIKYIILTHGHNDHIADAVDIAVRTNSVIIGSYELMTYIEKIKLYNNVIKLSIGGEIGVDEIKVKLVNAVHGIGVTELGNGWVAPACGTIVRISGYNIYHAGDTGLTYDMKLLGDYEKIDVAFLPIGNVYTMGPADALIATSFIKPKIVVPIHYNTFEDISVDPIEFSRSVMAENLGIIPKVLNPGQYVYFN